MPEKFIRCVKAVKKKGGAYNPYAVCRVSTGYFGSSHNIGMIHPVKDKKGKNCIIKSAVNKISGISLK